MRAHTTLNFPAVLLWAVVLCTCYTVFQFSTCMTAGKCVFVEDFSPFYMAGKQAAFGHMAAPYDLVQFRSWLQSYHAINFHPFLYPPHSLLLLYFLGLFPHAAALMLWYGAHILLLTCSLRTSYARQLYKGKTLLALLVFLPFVVLNILAGQMGIFWAALFIFFLAWRQSRPAAAGLLLAVFSFKPQLGVLLPLLLLRERNWKTLSYAAWAMAAMVALSMYFWGLGQWHDYLAMSRLSWQPLVTNAPEKYFTVAASPYMAFRMLGCNNQIAFGLQAGISLGILAKLIQTPKDSSHTYPLPLLLAAATLLITPYSFSYDSILLTLPILAILCRQRKGEEKAYERLALIGVIFIPIIAVKLQRFNIPYSFMAITLAFMAAFRGCRQEARRQLPHD